MGQYIPWEHTHELFRRRACMCLWNLDMRQYSREFFCSFTENERIDFENAYFMGGEL